jgi:hypothetical protein
MSVCDRSSSGTCANAYLPRGPLLILSPPPTMQPPHPGLRLTLEARRLPHSTLSPFISIAFRQMDEDREKAKAWCHLHIVRILALDPWLGECKLYHRHFDVHIRTVTAPLDYSAGQIYALGDSSTTIRVHRLTSPGDLVWVCVLCIRLRWTFSMWIHFHRHLPGSAKPDTARPGRNESFVQFWVASRLSKGLRRSCPRSRDERLCRPCPCLLSSQPSLLFVQHQLSTVDLPMLRLSAKITLVGRSTRGTIRSTVLDLIFVIRFPDKL